ncbi:MAG TPA: ABC transporter permease subunit [Tepidisphaeraceae bacterium]|nr:ABC transporter permease subunit [Tepidisphaeraceae bacterium]
MALVLFHTEKVRQALKKPVRIGPELIVLAGAFALLGVLILAGREFSAPYQPHINISLSLWALPGYTMLSLSRGFAAYALSLIFTLIYGTIMAHNHYAEKVMLPALDVLQAIPVLGFLPGLVLAMVSLFPTRQIGLEIACIVMIFTAQAWNMTFSFHGSLRSIPTALREVAAVQRLSGWQIFSKLEVPAAMIGLVWNSMMSMAGGWFFLTVNEAFTLGDHDYRLPGIGSYMNEAIQRNNFLAMIAAIVAMTIMIVLVDQLFWRPIVVWSERFKLEDQSDASKPEAWILNVLQRSKLFGWVRHVCRRRPQAVHSAPPKKIAAPMLTPAALSIIVLIFKYAMLLALAIGAAAGAWVILKLLIALPIHNAAHHEDWIGVMLAIGASFLRTSAAVMLGAAWALPAGIMIGMSHKWSQRLQPIIQVVASFPAPMLFPLVTILLLILHVPFTIGCVALMLLGAQWYILFNVIAGAMAIPAELREVAEVYRLGRMRRWLGLYLPCVFPYLLTGLITAAGGAWNATIVSEYVQVRNTTFMAFGLGSLISRATSEGNFPLLAASVVAMSFTVVMINRLLWKRLYRLAENRYSLNV